MGAAPPPPPPLPPAESITVTQLSCLGCGGPLPSTDRGQCLYCTRPFVRVVSIPRRAGMSMAVSVCDLHTSPRERPPATHFDAPFLRAALRRLGRPVRDTVPVDPLVWVRQIDRFVKGPGRHKLEATCRRWGVELDGAAHDALVDCRATWHLMVALVERNPARFPATLAEVLDEQVSMAADQERDFQAFKARAAR